MKASCGTCDVRWTHAERRSHCTACHQTFRSHSVADSHRVKGQCRTREEMAEKGWTEREHDGWTDWGGAEMPDDVKAKWQTPAEREAHIAAEIARIEAAPDAHREATAANPEWPNVPAYHLGVAVALKPLLDRDIFRDPS